MTVKTTLDSFPARALKSNGKQLDKLIGKTGQPAKNFNSDPFKFYETDGKLEPTGKRGCHSPS